MGRIRTVKPELFKHEVLFDLERETGLPLRVAFMGLFTCCDREGRFKWRPRTLKLDVIPYDDVDFSRVLDALMSCDFIRKYVVLGVEYGVITNFSKHQVINNRESPSELPEPEENSYISTVSTREARVDVTTSTGHEGKGREGKGREGNTRRGDASTAAADALSNPPSKKVLTSKDLTELQIDPQVAADFLALRKAKRAPLTQTALDGIKAEAIKASWTLEMALRECLMRGWQGFNADWIKNGGNSSRQSKDEARISACNTIGVGSQYFGDSNGSAADSVGSGGDGLQITQGKIW